MAATQAPKGFGLLFALIGVPLILWSAWGANDELKALDSPDSRRKLCLERARPLSLPAADAEAMCGCIVREAARRGIEQRRGAYDRDGIRTVVELCYESHLAQ